MFDEFKNAFQRYNNGHVQLIIINVVIFMLMGVLFVVAKLSQTPEIFISVYKQFTLPSEPGELLQRPWTLITYFFAHHYSYSLDPGIPDQIGIGHIFFNMLGLYWFAKVFVEYL